jgi:hypothetical protein
VSELFRTGGWIRRRSNCRRETFDRLLLFGWLLPQRDSIGLSCEGVMRRPQVCKHRVCDHCGGRFGMVTHRWWGNKFCKRTCKNAYLRENHTPCQVGLSPVYSRSRVAPDRPGQVTLPPAGKSARRTDGRSRSQFRRARRARERTIALPPQWSRQEVERSFPSGPSDPSQQVRVEPVARSPG